MRSGDVNGGLHTESNLQALCQPCHGQKTKQDVALKSKVYRKAAANAGIKVKRSKPFPGSRKSGWKRKIDGSVEKRERLV